MQTTTNTFTYCGGTILTPWHVITAAHCVRPVSTLIVVVGAHNVEKYVDKTAIIYGVSQAVIHNSVDLAILVTKTEMQFKDVVD
ncbi:trypsin-like serine protease, partial [Shewanella sp. A25]|nr:trypsin-like serine protease [Shewanella shenzhenensis]